MSGGGWGVEVAASGNVQSGKCSGSTGEGSDTSSIGLDASEFYTIGSSLPGNSKEWGSSGEFDAVPRKYVFIKGSF